MEPMLFNLPADFFVLLPWSGVIEKFVLNFDMIDIVLWFPRLSWGEIMQAFGAVVLCHCASDQISRWALDPIKARIKKAAFIAIARRYPALATRFSQPV
jgi:hypothetical protein